MLDFKRSEFKELLVIWFSAGWSCEEQGVGPGDLTGPLWLEMISDSTALQLSPSSPPRADVLQRSLGVLRGWPWQQEGLGNVGRGDTDREEQLCQSWAAPHSQGSSGSTATGQPKDTRPMHALFR